MIDTAELRKLAEEQASFRASGNKEFLDAKLARGVIALLDELEATTKEMHARELHHFETEEMLDRPATDEEREEMVRAVEAVLIDYDSHDAPGADTLVDAALEALQAVRTLSKRP